MKLSTIKWWEKNDPRWLSVWKSREFRSLLEKDNWFTQSTLPLISNQVLGWYHPPENSRFYFSAWLLNSLQIRHYDNPLIHDLYVLHEALHAATLDNYFQNTPDAFVALRVNEIEVSLETEVWVYLREPSWVGKTFSPLWITDLGTWPDVKKTIKDIPGAWEKQYRALVDRLPLPNREETVVGNHTMTEKDIYYARRFASFYPQSESDHMVKKYEDLSVRWLNKILHDVEDVNSGRKILKKGDIDAFIRYLEKHKAPNKLPFAGLQLKPKTLSATAPDAPQFTKPNTKADNP